MNDDRPVTVETTFDVDLSADEAWASLRQLTADRDTAAGEWWLPGFECRGTEVEAVAGKRLEVVKAEHPCKDSTIVFTLEHLPSGSRIHVVQSGFDPNFVARAGEEFFRHARHILADVELFFRTGIVVQRAWRPWTQFGFRPQFHSFGTEVAGLDEEGWAARAGLLPGDIILTLAGVPVFDNDQLAVLQRFVGPGDDVEVTWVRGRERLAGTATI